MNDLTVVDSIYLDAQQKEDVRRLSSLGYSSKDIDRKSTRLNSSHWNKSRMPSSA